jgi:putative oxidoreductase
MKCALFNPSKIGQDEALLATRLILAYGFYTPAISKLTNIDSVAQWFASLGIPFPVLNAYMAGGTELLGVILLSLGLMTRFIALPLMVVMVVAITTVHLEHGFAAADNGFEIPLYYLIFLFILATHGSGKWSVDRWLSTRASCVV